MVAFKTQLVRRKVNSSDTCRGLSLSCPIMFLHSMSDCCSRSSPVSQSLTRPPISTVTMPPLSHSASRASVSETADIHAVDGERDSALKTGPRGKIRNHAKQAGGTRIHAMLPPHFGELRPLLSHSPMQGCFMSAFTHHTAQENPKGTRSEGRRRQLNAVQTGRGGTSVSWDGSLPAIPAAEDTASSWREAGFTRRELHVQPSSTTK